MANDRRLVTVEYLEEAVTTEQNRADNTFANSLKGTKSGTVILLDDVSPVTHEIGVKVRSKNIFNYDGVAFSANIPNMSTFVKDNNTLKFTTTERTVYFATVDIESFNLKPNTTYTSRAIVTLTDNGSSAIHAGSMHLSLLLQTNRTYDSSGKAKVYVVNGANLEKAGTYEIVTTFTTPEDMSDYKYIVTRLNDNCSVTFKDLQIELGTTATAYTPYVPDLTAVKVNVLGKNLITFPYTNMGHTYGVGDTYTHNGVTFTVNSDRSITANGTAGDENSEGAIFEIFSAYGTCLADSNNPITVTLSGCPSGGSSSTYLLAQRNHFFMDVGEGKTFQTRNTTTAYAIIIKSGTTVENLVFKPQLELGTTKTDYEPYIAPTEYTPNADGTVNGVTSLYPSTTLMTDTGGVIIDCEYNKDINKFSGVDVDVPTKTSELINDSNFATQDYVDEEIANFDFIKIVTELPETGLINRTYFVPKSDPTTNDLYDEYMWVDGKWELITTKQIEVDLTEYVKHTDINQSYDPLSENAQSGKAVKEALTTLGGHWETVMDIVWDFNDYIHIVSYDPETHIFTCNSGELDWATEGEQLLGVVAPVCDTNVCKISEMPLSNYRDFIHSGGYYFLKISDNQFTFKDKDGNVVALPNESTMDITKFHFEHIVPRTISNLNCKKARYTLTGLICAVSGYSDPPMFYSGNYNANKKCGNNSYVNGWDFMSFTNAQYEAIGEYLVGIDNTTQLFTTSNQYTEPIIRSIYRQMQKPLSNPIITNLKFEFDWNQGLNIPRNGGLFKLERWVE